jgi:hypothetical protein
MSIWHSNIHVGLLVNHFVVNVLHICLFMVLVFSNWDLVRHGYPWVPTDQAHGRPRQVGPAY